MSYFTSSVQVGDRTILADRLLGLSTAVLSDDPDDPLHQSLAEDLRYAAKDTLTEQAKGPDRPSRPIADYVPTGWSGTRKCLELVVLVESIRSGDEVQAWAERHYGGFPERDRPYDSWKEMVEAKARELFIHSKRPDRAPLAVDCWIHAAAGILPTRYYMDYVDSFDEDTDANNFAIENTSTHEQFEFMISDLVGRD